LIAPPALARDERPPGEDGLELQRIEESPHPLQGHRLRASGRRAALEMPPQPGSVRRGRRVDPARAAQDMAISARKHPFQRRSNGAGERADAPRDGPTEGPVWSLAQRKLRR
jgi:hypothetical protein